MTPARAPAFLRLGRPLTALGLVVHSAFLAVSIAGTQIGLGLLALGVLLCALGSERPARTPLDLPMLAVAASFTLSGFVSAYGPAGLATLTLWRSLVGYWLVTQALARSPDPRRDTVRALACALSGLALAACVGIVQSRTGWDPLFALGLRAAPRVVQSPVVADQYVALGFYVSRLTFSHVTLFLLAAAFGALLSGLVKGKVRGWVLSCTLLGLAALVLTYARAAWLGLGVAVITLGASAAVEKWRGGEANAKAEAEAEAKAVANAKAEAKAEAEAKAKANAEAEAKAEGEAKAEAKAEAEAEAEANAEAKAKAEAEAEAKANAEGEAEAEAEAKAEAKAEATANAKAILLAFAGALALLAAALCLPGVRTRLFSAFDPGQNSDRLFLWSRALEIIRDHPLTGIGFGNYPRVCGAYYDRVDPSFFMRTYAHSVPLSILAETGPLGLLCALWLVLATLRSLLRARAAGNLLAPAGLAAFFALCFVAQLHDVHIDSKAMLAFWFVVALATASAPAPRAHSAVCSTPRGTHP